MSLEKPPKIYELYAAHIANVPSHLTETELSSLFAPAGDVKDVFIQPAHPGQLHTFAFVRYKTVDEVKAACKIMSNTRLDGQTIIVSLSDSTRRRLSGKQIDIEHRSITREPLPRMEGKYVVNSSEEKLLHKKLKASLNCLNSKNSTTDWLELKTPEDTKLFLKDFKNVLVGMANVPHAVGVDPVTFGARETTKAALEETILRFHQPTYTPQLFKEKDIDLTIGNKSLSAEEVEKHFSNISLPCTDLKSDGLEGNISILNYDEFCNIRKSSVQ